MSKKIVYLLLLLTGLCAGQNYLSNLSASKDDPLFTTYAAALERSEFIVDEGYHLMWYDADDGIDFQTDNAGHLCLAFKFNGEIRYFLTQMHNEPVVTASYSDLIKYHYYPFENIRVEIFFLVYSSRIAIQDVNIFNTGSSPARLSVYPFLHHPGDVLTNVELIPEQDGFIFGHREPPDGWTLGHGVPYQEDLLDVFLIDTIADAWGAYPELGTIAPPKSNKASNSFQRSALERRLRGSGSRNPGTAAFTLDNYCVESGLVHHSDGSLCTHTPPQAQQLILHNGSDQEILTENAPRWEGSDPNIPGDGFQSCELGHFDNPPIAPGDSFQVIFTCLATREQGMGRGVVPPVLPAPGGVNLDITLSTEPRPPVPQHVQATFYGNNSAVIYWRQQPGYTYSLYRRNALTEEGEYDRIAEGIADSLWFDFGLDSTRRYGYLVVARDSDGNFSGHSAEVSNLGNTPFFNNAQDSLLSKQIPSGELHLTALQKDYSLAAGDSAHLRIIRGVTEAGGDIQSLITECRYLQPVELQQFRQADEVLYSRIPRLNFSDPDKEMMYWSAFSMIRQCFLPPEGQCSYNYNVYSREPTWGWGHAGQVFHENLSMLAYVFMDPNSAQESQWVFAERMNSQPQWPPGYIPYRVGPYLNEVNYLAGEYSSSAPWFSWQNWEIFKVSQDTAFLEQMYQYGRDFYNFWITERDDDGDGLCEWGGHSFWESVRDFNVIWHVLGGWADPHNANKVEALDLNCELVMEARSLAKMAQVLGFEQEVREWRRKARVRADSINALMWDPQTHFYYHVEKNSHTFTYQDPNDLKHKEHIGFLPIWAGIADSAQLNYLLQELHNPNTFGRPYGTPLLDYSDPLDPSGVHFYHHAIYPEWDVLVFRGLMEHYQLESEAQYIAGRIFDGVLNTLKKQHNFFESHHADTGDPYGLHTYIWTGLVARMLIDLESPPVAIELDKTSNLPKRFDLLQNYPNPFNSQTIIRFRLAKSERVTIKIYNLLGETVNTLIDENMEAGRFRVVWEGKDNHGNSVSSGLYFLQMTARSFQKTRKLILIR